MELMCDKVCIIDKGKVIEIKDLRKSKVESVDEATGTEIYEFMYETDNDEKAFELAKTLKLNCEKDKENRLIVHATKKEVAHLTRSLVENDINVFIVNIVSKSLEELYIETTEKKGKVK